RLPPRSSWRPSRVLSSSPASAPPSHRPPLRAAFHEPLTCERLFPNRQHDPEASLAAHHAIISLGDTLQRISLVHRPYAGPHAKRERVLRVDGRPGIPALDRT